MSDLRGTDRQRAPGLRWGPTLALVVLAFVIGVALAVYVLRREPASTAAPAPTRPVAVQPSVAVRSPAAAAVDPVTLATRETALAAQLTALEARTAAVDVESAAAGSQAARAEMVLTAAAVRRAIDRGQPLGYLDAPLRARFGAVQPRAVAVVLHAARAPVTLDTLRSGLDAIAADLLVDRRDGWFGQWRGAIGRLVVVRRADAPTDTPADRLDRARRLLDAGRVDSARSEVARLPGAGEAAAWNAAADRYVLARLALDRLESVALAAPAVPAAM